MKNGINNPNYRHGGCTTNKPEYNSWRAMVARCTDEKYWCFHRYGGRGVKICSRWLEKRTGFVNFLSDMGKKPGKGYSIDRINNDGNYCPENCRWANQKDQVRNSLKVKNAMVTSDELKTAMVSSSVVYDRLKKGWSKDKALHTPAMINGKISGGDKNVEEKDW